MFKATEASEAARRKLKEMFTGLGRNETLDWKVMDAAIGTDVRKTMGHVVYGARKDAREESGVVLRAVRGVGLQRCDSDGIIDRGASHLRSVRRKVKLAVSEGECVVVDELTESRRKEHLARQSGLALIQHVSAPSRIKKYEPKIQNGRLPVVELVASMN